MNAAQILHVLRDGGRPSLEEIRWFTTGIANGTITDAQAGAFAMAVCHVGLGEAGRVALTEAMRDSGDCLTWHLNGPVLDKHSTGGIGDCVSIALAPALAACGAYVPMVSGRGLGHTGGTLDKLESIPGFATELDEARFQSIVSDTGYAIVSATQNIAPADKRMYAIRDVTGTVESIDLITASILSKKLAAGLEGLVMDVKTGSGAFMPALDQSRALARSIVETASGAGCPTRALITDMSQPLAPSVGNAVEVTECINVLSGSLSSPLAKLTCALGAELLALGGLVPDIDEGFKKMENVLASGLAAEVFSRSAAAQGAPTDFLENWSKYLPSAPVQMAVKSDRSGYVSAWDARALGMAVVELGGGRKRGGEAIDHAAGLSRVARIGERVETGDPIAIVHARSGTQAQTAAHAVLAALTVSESGIANPLIVETVAL